MFDIYRTKFAILVPTFKILVKTAYLVRISAEFVIFEN